MPALIPAIARTFPSYGLGIVLALFSLQLLVHFPCLIGQHLGIVPTFYCGGEKIPCQILKGANGNTMVYHIVVKAFASGHQGLRFDPWPGQNVLSPLKLRKIWEYSYINAYISAKLKSYAKILQHKKTRKQESTFRDTVPLNFT